VNQQRFPAVLAVDLFTDIETIANALDDRCPDDAGIVHDHDAR
jgi:asparagine synthetase B (glutamine-hydrolysing)